MDNHAHEWLALDPDHLECWLKQVWERPPPRGAHAPSPWLVYPLLRLATPWAWWTGSIWRSVEDQWLLMNTYEGALPALDSDQRVEIATGEPCRHLAESLAALAWLASRLAPECRSEVLSIEPLLDILEGDWLILILQALELIWQVARIPFTSEGAALVGNEATWLVPRLGKRLLQLSRHEPMFDDLFRALRTNAQRTGLPLSNAAVVVTSADTSTDELSASAAGNEFAHWESRSSPDSSFEMDTEQESIMTGTVASGREGIRRPGQRSIPAPCSWCQRTARVRATRSSSSLSGGRLQGNEPGDQTANAVDALEWTMIADAFTPHWQARVQQIQEMTPTNEHAKNAGLAGEARPQNKSHPTSWRVHPRHWCRYRLEWGLLRLSVRYQALALALASSTGANAELESTLASESHLWDDVIEMARGAFSLIADRPATASSTDGSTIHPTVARLVQRSALRLLATAAATWKWEKPLLTGMLHGRGHGWLFQALNRALEECEPSPIDEASSQAERLELYLSTMGRLLRRERRLHQLDPRLQLLLVGLFQKLAMIVQRSEPACLLSIWSLQFCTLVLRQARPDDAFFGMLRPELETIQRSLLEQLPQVIQGSLSSTPLFQERQVFRERLARQAWAQHDAALALQETFGSLTLLESTWIRVAWRFLLMRYESQASSGAMPTNPPLMPTLLPEGLTSASPVPSPRLSGTQAVHADRQGLVAGQDTPEPLTLHQASIRVLLEQVLWHPRCFGGAVWSVAAQTLALAVNEDPANAAIFWEEHTVDGLRQVLAAAATADASTATCLPATAASYVAAWHALDALCIRREQLDALLEHHDQDDHGRQVLPTDHPEANNQQARRLPSMQSMLQSLVRAPLYRPVLARALFQSRHDLSQTKGLLKRGDEIPALYERVVFAELQTWLADRVANRRPAELVDNAQRCLANMNGGTGEESRLYLLISMETTRLVTLEMAFVLLESLRKSMLSSSRLTGERHPSSSVTRAQLDQLQSSLWQEALVTLRFPLGLYLLSSTADRTHPTMFLLIQATESVRRHALGTGSVLDSGQVRRLLCEYLGQTLPNVLEQVSPVHCAVMKEDLASSTTRTKWVLRGASALDQVHLVGALGIVLLLLALMGQRFKQKYRFRTSTTTSQEVGQASAEGQVTDGTLVHAVGCLERLCRYALAQSGFETVTVYPIPLPSKRGLEMEVVMIEPLVEDEDEEQARDTSVTGTTNPRPMAAFGGADTPQATGTFASRSSDEATTSSSLEKASDSGKELIGLARALALFAVHVRSFYQCVLHETELDTALADVLVGHWAATETLFSGEVWDLVPRTSESGLRTVQCVYLVGLVSSLRALLYEASLPRRTSRRFLSVLYARGLLMVVLRLGRRLRPPVSKDTCRALDALFDLFAVSLTVEDLMTGDSSGPSLEATARGLHPVDEHDALASRLGQDEVDSGTDRPQLQPSGVLQGASAEQSLRGSYLAFLSVMVRLLLQSAWSQWPRLFVLRLLNLSRLLLTVDATTSAAMTSPESSARWRTTERVPQTRSADLVIDTEHELWSFVESYGQSGGFPIRPARMDQLLPLSRRLVRLLQIGHRRQRIPWLHWPWFQAQLRVWVRQQALDHLTSAKDGCLDAALVAECWSLLPPWAWLGENDPHESDATHHSRIREGNPLARLIRTAPAVAVHWLGRLGVADSSVALLRTLVEYLEPIMRSCNEFDASLAAYLVLYALIMRLFAEHSATEPESIHGRSPDRQGYITTVPYIPRGVLTARLPRLLARQALRTLWQYRWKRVRLPTALEQLLALIRPLWSWSQTQCTLAIEERNRSLLWHLLDLDLAALEAVVAAAHVQIRAAAPTASQVVDTVLRIEGLIQALVDQREADVPAPQEIEAALMARQLHAWVLLAEYVRMALYEHDIGLLIAAFDRVLREAFREAHQTGQHQGSVSSAALNPVLERLAAFHPMALSVSMMRCFRPVETTSSSSLSRDRRSEVRYALNTDCPPISVVHIDGALLELLLAQRHPAAVLALVSSLSTYGAPLAASLSQLLREPRHADDRAWLVHSLIPKTNTGLRLSAGCSNATVDWRYLSVRALVVYLSAYATGEAQTLALQLLTQALGLALTPSAGTRLVHSSSSSSSSSSSVHVLGTEDQRHPGDDHDDDNTKDQYVMERVASLTTRVLVHDVRRALATTETGDLLLQLYERHFHRAKQADILLESIHQLAVFHGPGLLQYGPDQHGRYPLLKSGAVLDGHRLGELFRSLPSVKSDLFDYGAELGPMGRARLPEPLLESNLCQGSGSMSLGVAPEDDKDDDAVVDHESQPHMDGSEGTRPRC